MGKHSMTRSAKHGANISAGLLGLPYTSTAMTDAEKTSRFRLRKQGALIWYKLAHPCVDCGETDPRVLTFDHVRGEKLFTLNAAVKGKGGLRAMIDEIRKCDVVCANYHTIRTIDRIGDTTFTRLGVL